jgi:hypothetical protein
VAPIWTMIPTRLSSHLVICVAEDRQFCDPGFRLFLISLCRYSNDIAVTVFYPEADQEFLDWVHELDSEKSPSAQCLSQVPTVGT